MHNAMKFKYLISFIKFKELMYQGHHESYVMGKWNLFQKDFSLYWGSLDTANQHKLVQVINEFGGTS